MASQDTSPTWEEQALAALDAGEIDQALTALIAGYGRAILGRFRRLFASGLDTTVGQAQPDPADSPEETVLKQQQAERLRRALGKLRHKERDLLTMYYLEELSLDRIAERYSVSRGTVSKQVFAAQE